MKRTIIIALLLIIAIIGWYGYKKFKQQTPDIVNQKPDVITTATDLISAFNKDTASAKKKFIDKVVEVTGNVKSIDTTGTIVLGEDSSPSAVTVGLDRRHIKDYEKVKVGAVATTQGICSGYQKSNSNSDDLLAGLGTTVELRSAGIKNKK